MEYYSLIENFDFENLKSQVESVISYSQNEAYPQINELMNTWKENKSSFISTFGGLIYEHPEPITIELSKDQKRNLISSFLAWVDKNYGSELTNFLLVQSQSMDSFLSNRVCSEFQAPNGKRITAGMRLGKACGNYLPLPADRERVQNKLSEVIQQNKISGILCLSVHPLDFLSLSENAADWTSCYALEGSSCAASLTLMEDKSTFICYLKSEKGDVILPNFPVDIPWNSKKWRTLLFKTDDFSSIVTGKSYPFAANPLLAWTKFMLEKLTKKDYNLWEDYCERDVVCLNDIFYCDIVKNTSYIPQVLKAKKINGKHKLIIANPHTKCITCGTGIITNSATMRCTSCELAEGTKIIPDYIEECTYCGRRTLYTHLSWIGDSDYMCPDCVDEHTTVCEICGESFIFDEESAADDFICEKC